MNDIAIEPREAAPSDAPTVAPAPTAAPDERGGLARLGSWRAALLHAIDTKPLAGLLLICAFALLLRAPLFGDWANDVDDQFYSLVGQRLLAGDLLYVDIWDRKGPVIFLIYAAIAAISRQPIAFQIGATLFAIAGAYGIFRIAARLSGPRGALMAALAYLGTLARFGGATGQSPVFYNTLMIALAGTVLLRLDRLKSGRIDAALLAAMLSGGLAIACKQSAAFECVFIGLFCLGVLRFYGQSPWPRLCAQALALGLAGAAPLLVTGLYYAHIGHFDTLWHALVTSNFRRIYVSELERVMRLAGLFGQGCLLLAFAVLGLVERKARGRLELPTLFVAGWMGAAIFSVLVFPNVFDHYALPLLPPMAILAAEFFARRQIALLALGTLIVVNGWYGGTFDLRQHLAAHRTLPAFEAYVIDQTPHKTLLVWGNHSLLYALVGARPPHPLAFPHHLYDGAESGVSGIDEVAEVRRILAARPETVVLQKDLRSYPVNQASDRMVRNYVLGCRRQRDFTVYQRLEVLTQTVYSQCAR